MQVLKVVSESFLLIKSVLLLNNFDSNDKGVSKKKKIIERIIVGINLLKRIDNLNQIISIKTENFGIKMLKPETEIMVYNMILDFTNSFNNKKPKTIVKIVKKGLEFDFIKIVYK